MKKGNDKNDNSKRREKLKATDLYKNDDVLKKLRKKNYRKQYDKCIETIRSVNEHCHVQYTTYNVPAMIPGEPYFDMDECIIFLKEELRKADFYVRLMKPGNILYISWRPRDVEKVQKLNSKHRNNNYNNYNNYNSDDNMDKENEVKEIKSKRPIIQFNPDSALSNAHLTTSLIMDNPDFAHYKTVQKYKKYY